MKCVVCGNDFDEFTGYIRAIDNEQFKSLDNADDIVKEFDNRVTESICSEKCFTAHMTKFGKGRYRYSKVYFCPGAKECEELGNLRGMCEQTEPIKIQNGDDMLFGFSLFRSKWCEPGIAGMIKSSVKLHQSNLEVIESIKKFDRTSTILSGIMVALTIVILIATVLMYVK